jgi:hypothetical protein
VLLNGGAYTYTSGDLHTDVDGKMVSAAALPGWRFVRENLTVSIFAGPVAQDYRLTPYDPGSKLHGAYAGAQFATEVWYQPTGNLMAAVNGAIASIGPTGSIRAAFGFRVFDAMFVGPEPRCCGAATSSNWRPALTSPLFASMRWNGRPAAAGRWIRTSAAGLICGWVSARNIDAARFLVGNRNGRR